MSQAYTTFLGLMLRELHRTDLLAALEDRELRVLLAFLKHVNLETRSVIAGIETLAKASGVATATVYRALGSLHERGVLVWEKGVKLALGAVLLGAATPLEHDVVLEAKASREHDVVLNEELQVAAKRKGSTAAYFAKLVEAYGLDQVRDATKMMTLQYPDDTKVKRSFAKLVALALEGKWVHAKTVEADAKARETAARADEPPHRMNSPQNDDVRNSRETSATVPDTKEAAIRYVRLFSRSGIPGIRARVRELVETWGLHDLVFTGQPSSRQVPKQPQLSQSCSGEFNTQVRRVHSHQPLLLT